MINLKVIILIMIEMKLIHLYNIKISKMKIKFYPKMNKQKENLLKKKFKNLKKKVIKKNLDKLVIKRINNLIKVE